MKKLGLLGGALLLVAALVIMAGHVGAVAVAQDRAEWPEPDWPAGWEGIAPDWSEWAPNTTWEDIAHLWPDEWPEWPPGATWEKLVTAAYVTESGGSYVVEEPCEKLLALHESIRRKPLPPPLVVPQAIEERILRAVDADCADTKITYLNRVKEDLYSALVVVTSSGETSFVEVIIEGERTEVRELEPILIDETLTEEIIIEEFKVENKHPAAPAKIVERSGTRTYELHLTQSSIITITRWRENTVRNVWGWVLARLVAMGRFGVDVGVEVLWVVDHSYTSTHWGWTTDWFSSSATFAPALSSVTAHANFDGPLGDDVTLSTWVGVDRNAEDHP